MKNYFKFYVMNLRSSFMLLLIDSKSWHSWGDRSFCSAMPCTWNSLTFNLMYCLFVQYHKIQISSQNLSYVTGFQGLILLCLSVLLSFFVCFSPTWTTGSVDVCTLHIFIIIIMITIHMTPYMFDVTLTWFSVRCLYYMGWPSLHHLWQQEIWLPRWLRLHPPDWCLHRGSQARPGTQLQPR